MKRLAVAVTAEFPDLRPDWPLLRAALAERNIEAITQVWNDPAADWEHLDLVVANGAWDNIFHPDAFCDWADAVARHTPVVNRPGVLRWNIDKRYLADLAAEGVPTVPTRWLDPTDPVAADPADLSGLDLPSGEFVVKPNISGGAFMTARYADTETDHAECRIHISHLLGAGRTVMLQPYQSGVDCAEAETGLVFLGGHYSHAIRKAALLPPGARPAHNLHDESTISPTRASDTQRAIAAGALAVAERRYGPTTYARVDLVPTSGGHYAVLELEILDPALFLDHHPPAVAAFAYVLAAAVTTGA